MTRQLTRPRLLLCLALCGLRAFARDSPSLLRLTHDGLEKQRPSWSPDGRLLAFARHEAGGAHIWQYVMPADAPPDARRLTDRPAPDYNAAFLPDGRSLLFVPITLSGTQGNLDIARIDLDGSHLQTLAADHNGQLSHQDWPAPAPDGRRFAFSSTHEGNQEIYVADLDGSHLVRVTQSPGLDAHPCWSPDGSRLAFATDRWGGLELASSKPDGTDLVRLTTSPRLDDYPAWSPDGSKIAFVSNRDSQFEIYLIDPDGSKPVNLTRHPARDTYPTWTPDGLGVTFVSDRHGGVDLYTLRLDAEPEPR